MNTPVTTIKQRFVIDESGSMLSQQSRIISGFNEQIQTMKAEEKQKNVRYLVSLIKFNSSATVVFKDKALNDVPEMTTATYQPSGWTALNDAIGMAIDTAEVGETNVIVTIMTDGQENSSREFTKAAIKLLIDIRQKENKWGFVYFGANVDAWSEASSLGISNAVNYTTANTVGAINSMSSCRAAYTTSSVTGDYSNLNKLADGIDESDLTK